MSTIASLLTADHRACDEAFVQAEDAVGRGDWPAAEHAFERFQRMLVRHFEREEAVLFPAVEGRTGQSAGPTAVMRDEHERMRAMLDDLSGLLQQRDAQAYQGLSETLLIMMQQHNVKEEQVLYPLSDRVLAPERDAILRALQAGDAGAG